MCVDASLYDIHRCPEWFQFSFYHHCPWQVQFGSIFLKQTFVVLKLDAVAVKMLEFHAGLFFWSAAPVFFSFFYFSIVFPGVKTGGTGRSDHLHNSTLTTWHFLHWAPLSSGSNSINPFIKLLFVESNPLASRPGFHFWSCDCCINLGVLIVEVTPRRRSARWSLWRFRASRTRQSLDSESAESAHRESNADTISRPTKCSLPDMGGDGIFSMLFF